MEVIDISKNISLFGADKVRVGLGGVGGGVVDYTGGYTGHRQHRIFITGSFRCLPLLLP